MRILDRYIVREIFRHALLGLVVFTFVFFVPQLVRLMELFVRHSGSGAQVLKLFICIFPAVFVFTVPMATLIGVLLGLGRMSADSEIIALTALGIGRRRILLPVGVLALAGAVVTLGMTTWLGPVALRTFRSLQADLITSQVSFTLQPRVFDERFPNKVLYVNDVTAAGTQWHGVFLAETGGEGGSRLTLAENAIVIAEPKQGKLDLHLRGGTTHEFSREDADHYSVTAFGQSDWPIEFSGLAAAQPRQLNNPERSIRELWNDHGAGWREARVELHRRFAFPIACFAFALVAVPLGAQPRRGGRAAAALLAVILISSYYLLSVMGAGLARQGTLTPAAGIWIANAVLFALGLVLLPRMEQFRGESRLLRPMIYLKSRRRLLRRRRAQARARAALSNGANGDPVPQEILMRSSGSFPQLIDIYVLRRFFFYFAVLMGAFVFLFETFTFFELLDDIARHRVPFLIVVDYFRYLAPYLLYQLAPLGALVAVLVTLGIMSKSNEIVAIKASGISLYRLAVPLLLAGLALAVTMIVLDDTYLPQNLFGGLTVLEIDQATFQVQRRIFASRARWSETQKVWALEGSWVRDFADGAIVRYERLPAIASLPELTEPPSYFNREVRQAFQMSWRELGSYIAGLQRAGFDVSTLTVQWHEKIAFPLMAPVSMLLAIPFALLVGTRGAVGGVVLGIGFGVAYLSIARLLEAMGGVGQLPPFLAGWSPDIIFFFLGLYFFFKMPT